MSTNVIMPSLGYDMTAEKVARWIKQEGDAVEKGGVIAEIDTEKATVEIEANASGVLKKILVAAGETVPIGTPIGVIGDAAEKIETPSATPQAAPPSEPSSEESASPAQKTSASAQPSPTPQADSPSPA